MWTGGPLPYPRRHVLHRMIREDRDGSPTAHTRVARLFSGERPRLEAIRQAIQDYPEFRCSLTRVEIMGVILRFEVAYVRHFDGQTSTHDDDDKENEPPPNGNDEDQAWDNEDGEEPSSSGQANNPRFVSTFWAFISSSLLTTS